MCVCVCVCVYYRYTYIHTKGIYFQNEKEKATLKTPLKCLIPIQKMSTWLA